MKKIVAFNKELILSLGFQEELYNIKTQRTRKSKKQIGETFKFTYNIKVFQEQ